MAAERITDDRLAEIEADHVGLITPWATNPEVLAIVRELRAWRKYKLTDEEKAALTVVREAFLETGDIHEIAWTAIERLTGGKSNG